VPTLELDALTMTQTRCSVSTPSFSGDPTDNNGQAAGSMNASGCLPTTYWRLNSSAKLLVIVLLVVANEWNVVDAFRTNINKGRSPWQHATASKSAFGKIGNVPISQLWMRNGASSDADDSAFSSTLIESLDLIPVIEKVTAHAGTFRGRQALLALVQSDVPSKRSSLKNGNPSMIASRKRRVVTEHVRRGDTATRSGSFRLSTATSAEQARQEYDLVDQAVAALQTVQNTTFPPIYSAESSPWDTKTVPDTDDDSWLYLHVPEWTLEHILQAEQVIGKLLRVHDWATSEGIQTWMPLLAEIGSRIDRDALASVLEAVGGAVEIARVRSVTDPNGRSTFTFRLKESKYRILEVLREKETNLRERVRTNESPHLVRDLEALKEDLQTKRAEIQFGLAQSIAGSLRVIDDGLDTVAHLDTIFARAVFGQERNGRRPIVQSEGRIDVKQFVHPLLELEDSKASQTTRAVPVDLHLSSEVSERALIISGPNGGGKTLAMKSFGVVSVLCKLGIPIPTLKMHSGPIRTDFFDEILVSVGDGQNVDEGQSTFTAQLNAYSTLIKTVGLQAGAVAPKTHLVLIDELGGGTEANAGGAIAQAVLENILGTGVCRIVVTTHSARLKALSFENDDFGCATVLLQKKAESSEYQLPAFELQYGVIGESYALGAASRCTPLLPDDVLARAADLMVASNEETGDTSGDYVRALTHSLEKQVEITNDARIEAEIVTQNSVVCQKALLSLASAYDRHLALLEERIERCFQELKDDASPLELLGETLSELRVVKRQVQSELGVLRERGLKILPNSYQLSDGEAVVIVAGGVEIASGKVVLLDAANDRDRELKLDEVAVVPSFSLWEEAALDDPLSAAPIIYKRYQLAIWDFDSLWQDEQDDRPTYNSVKDATRRLNVVLSTLKTAPNVPINKSDGSGSKPTTKATSTFTSSRERKATKQKPAKRKRK